MTTDDTREVHKTVASHRRTRGVVALEDPTPDDLMGVADAVGEPRETLGQRSLYDPDAMVPYGVTGQVHLRCREARKQAATDLICAACGSVFGRVGSA